MGKCILHLRKARLLYALDTHFLGEDVGTEGLQHPARVVTDVKVTLHVLKPGAGIELCRQDLVPHDNRSDIQRFGRPRDEVRQSCRVVNEMEEPKPFYPLAAREKR